MRRCLLLPAYFDSLCHDGRHRHAPSPPSGRLRYFIPRRAAREDIFSLSRDARHRPTSMTSSALPHDSAFSCTKPPSFAISLHQQHTQRRRPPTEHRCRRGATISRLYHYRPLRASNSKMSRDILAAAANGGQNGAEKPRDAREAT